MNYVETYKSLSPAMRKALAGVTPDKVNTHIWGATFATLDALRKRDLLERYSDRVHKSVYATGNGLHVQFVDRKGHWRHEWWLTPEGEQVQLLMKDVQEGRAHV